MTLPRHIEINEVAMMRFKSVSQSKRIIRAKSLMEIATAVTSTTKAPMKYLWEKTRRREVAETKQIFSFIAYGFGYTHKQIVAFLHQKELSNVSHSKKQVQNQIDVDPKFSEMVERIKKKL